MARGCVGARREDGKDAISTLVNQASRKELTLCLVSTSLLVVEDKQQRLVVLEAWFDFKLTEFAFGVLTCSRRGDFLGV